ncbi:hypothetical protein ABVK25_008184 [Lepraria finkii]|uniref:Uncharacterized protein n=1 Tax=Lepraria finkii TaxID=1340010 RepID=A0ABR4B0U4_9LECA
MRIFAGSGVVATFELWYEDAWGDFEVVDDHATEAEDHLAILADDLNTRSVEAALPSPPPPAKNDFQEKLMVKGFDDQDLLITFRCCSP